MEAIYMKASVPEHAKVEIIKFYACNGPVAFGCQDLGA